MAGRTVALNFIATTQEMADQMIERYSKYFDGIEYEVGIIKSSFSEVRNRVLDKTRKKGYDYMFWCDTDDEVDGLENIRQLVGQMVDRNVDSLYFPYQYAFNEQGECIVLQWRERIIKLGHPFEWMGAIHESLISVSSPLLDRSEALVVRHAKTVDSHHESAARNHKILLAEYKLADRDPRITHYLALSFFNLGDYKKAVKLFREHINTSGWDEDQYRSYFYIGQAYGLLGQNKDVLQAASDAMALIPVRPEAYVLAATAEFELGHNDKCLEWLRVASTKPAPRESLSAIDPTYYTYKAEFLAAQAFLRMGKVSEAHEQLKQVLTHSPNFPPAVELAPLFQELYDDQVAVKRLEWLTDYLSHYGGKPEKLFESIPDRLMADPRLISSRNKVVKPKKWSDRSIVFFSGHVAEPWGPDMLEKGIGGSEEAVIYLSRELANLGWDVTVYNDREEPYEDEMGQRNALAGRTNPVHYKPWTTFNPADEFNVIVGWRNPAFFSTVKINARLKLIDMHDMPLGHTDITEIHSKNVDKFMFKSKFQADIVDIPDSQKAIISNGIVTQQFNKDVKRRKHSVGYYSSYDRGLPCLLHLWPRIKEQVPDATLDIYYGWNSFDQFHKDNPERMKWKWQTIRDLAKLKKEGVTEHGRVSHERLAEVLLETEVWAYPTQFPEINCITALKAGKAGCIPVTSGYAALQETVLEDQPDYAETIYTDKLKQDEFVERIVKALKEGRNEEKRAYYSQKYDKYDWSQIAKKWDHEIR